MQFPVRNCNVRILKEMKIAESLVFSSGFPNKCSFVIRGFLMKTVV